MPLQLNMLAEFDPGGKPALLPGSWSPKELVCGRVYAALLPKFERFDWYSRSTHSQRLNRLLQ
jgi:hypothetical protein